jgi:negative regulator of flagellin synthesis FlgM
MYVSNNSALQALASLYSNDQVKNVKRTPQAESTSFRDELVISQEAQSFSDLLNELKTMDEVRDDKVQNLAQEIKSDTYRPDASAVAERIMNLQF